MITNLQKLVVVVVVLQEHQPAKSPERLASAHVVRKVRYGLGVEQVPLDADRVC